MLSAVSCQRSTDEVWNDTKTASRHMGRGVGTLGGKQGVSRQVHDRNAFAAHRKTGFQSTQHDFIPLEDDESQYHVGEAEEIPPPPSESPGDEGSSIPGIQAFKDPSLDPELAAIFEHIHFAYNSSLFKGDENFQTLQKVVRYLNRRPNLYIFVEGHCDKRGSAAYNFALGANRANTVRSTLIREGLSPDRVFTISYGKERPLVESRSEEAFSKNRRAQFKVYAR